MNTTYPYCNRDLLTEPEYYMFSSFKGLDTLEAYSEVRRQGVERLTKQYNYLLANNDGPNLLLPHLPALEHLLPKSVAASNSTLEDSAHEGPVSPTVARLLELLAGLLNDAQGQHPDLHFFIGRFEVTKRLRCEYDANGKPATEEWENATAHGLLLLCSALHHEGTGSLKSLNCLLKLGDMACSYAFNDADADALCTALAGLHAENRLIRSLGKNKGVAW